MSVVGQEWKSRSRIFDLWESVGTDCLQRHYSEGEPAVRRLSSIVGCGLFHGSACSGFVKALRGVTLILALPLLPFPWPKESRGSNWKVENRCRRFSGEEVHRRVAEPTEPHRDSQTALRKSV
jgi:hypothetical protein